MSAPLGFGTDGESAPLAFGSIFVGYLLGALYAEVTTGRPVPRGRRTASLVRRELLCSGVALGLQASDVRLLHATMLVPAVVCLIGSLVAVQDVADSRWSVRRPARPDAAVSA
jgi:hypothetical protein